MSDQATMIRSESAITIGAPADEVWKALTTPSIIREWFFGAYTETDWKVGSPIVHTGEFKGKPYRDKGRILAFEPNQRLSHTHWSDRSGRPDRPENYETVTYELRPDGDRTELAISEENLPSDEAKAMSQKAWTDALGSLKRLLEGNGAAAH
jgi:uncharacterized protein YndB with AHSA1/START domain